MSDGPYFFFCTGKIMHFGFFMLPDPFKYNLEVSDARQLMVVK